jgi:L,D-peptidoglycan transpeptidase YkuD (ErfK/YbiS/YcfS/YnhG family)
MVTLRFAVLAGLAIGPAQSTAAELPCPPILAGATKLVLVTAATMDTASATLETFKRNAPGESWRRVTGPENAVVGESGLGWGLTFRDFARGGESLKVEGDGRSPAGIFAIGAPFGFAASSLPSYLKLEDGVQICVDDPASPFYSRIVPRAEAKGASGEDMPAIPLYRRGIVVDYPTSGAERGGSCIFLHVWQGEGVGTSGCVAAPEPTIAHLQDWTPGGTAVIAILPESAKDRFAACLPSG